MAELSKANPYRDAAGKFASASGGIRLSGRRASGRVRAIKPAPYKRKKKGETRRASNKERLDAIDDKIDAHIERRGSLTDPIIAPKIIRAPKGQKVTPSMKLARKERTKQRKWARKMKQLQAQRDEVLGDAARAEQKRAKKRQEKAERDKAYLKRPRKNSGFSRWLYEQEQKRLTPADRIRQIRTVSEAARNALQNPTQHKFVQPLSLKQRNQKRRRGWVGKSTIAGLELVPMGGLVKGEPTSTDVHLPTIMGNQKRRKKKIRKSEIVAKKAKLRDPKGGLTAAGRKHFKRTEGANLKPGVKGKADTPEKMRRKGSFLTRFFTNPSGPMKDDKGRPTRLALSAAAWGEPVPQDRASAARLAAKGRSLLERYESAKKKKVAKANPYKDASGKFTSRNLAVAPKAKLSGGVVRGKPVSLAGSRAGKKSRSRKTKIGSGTKVDVDTANRMMRDYDVMESRARRQNLGDPQDYAQARFRQKYGVSAMDVESISLGLEAPNSITLPGRRAGSTGAKGMSAAAASRAASRVNPSLAELTGPNRTIGQVGSTSRYKRPKPMGRKRARAVGRDPEFPYGNRTGRKKTRRPVPRKGISLGGKRAGAKASKRSAAKTREQKARDFDRTVQRSEQMRTRINPTNKRERAKAQQVRNYMMPAVKKFKNSRFRAYAVERVKQMTSGKARPDGMSKKYGMTPDDVRRYEIVLASIFKSGRIKYGI